MLYSQETMNHTHDDNYHIHGQAMDIINHMGSHSMVFHFGYNEVILFEFWTIHSFKGLLGSVVILFIISVLYEGLKCYRDYLYNEKIVGSKGTYQVNGGNNETKNSKWYFLHASHILQTLLHIVQVTISYFLMLVIMTFNVWLCLAVIFGAGIGFLIFGWRKTNAVHMLDHCM